MQERKKVGILIFDDVEVLDYCGPYEVSARFIEKIRIEAAVKLLEETRHALETIARECGFQSGEHFRLAFVRCFKITPGEYRDRFWTGTD